MASGFLLTPSGNTLTHDEGGRIYVAADLSAGDLFGSISAQAWAAILQRLLPEGELWDYSGNVGKLLAALAEEFQLADQYLLDAIGDLLTIRTEEVLGWWETTLGLPDSCDCLILSELTFADRRAAVLDKLSARQSVTNAGLIIRAHRLGYEISIRNCRPWRVGHSSVAQPIYSSDWAHTFYVIAPSVSVRWARAGQMRAGDRIRTWGNQRLECWINRVKQSHTTALFSYGEN